MQTHLFTQQMVFKFKFIMKYYIILLFVILFSNSTFSQDNPGNLQFNRVVNQTGSFSGPTGFGFERRDVLNFTVPEGKIWKVTSSFVVGSTGGPLDGTNDVASAGFYKIGETNPIISFVARDNGYNNQIVWLSEGAYSFSVHVKINGKASFTALEFNIIPTN